MKEIRIKDVTDENIDDLWMCIPFERRDDPAFIKGMEQKRQWAMDMLQRWGSFAKIAYKGAAPVGQIQYKPLPAYGVVYIYCIYVPEKEHWQQGVATRLLDSLIEGMKKPQVWFEGQPALALVTKTFPGEKPGQYPARAFFTQRGFKRVGEDPDFLYYPLAEGFTLTVKEEELVEGFFGESQKVEYIPQEEDKGKAVIIFGPSFCPFAYPFLKKAEAYIREVAPEIPIRWIGRSESPDEVKKRGDFVGCVVNAKPIKSSVLDRESFQRDVKEAVRIE